MTWVGQWNAKWFGNWLGAQPVASGESVGSSSGSRIELIERTHGQARLAVSMPLLFARGISGARGAGLILLPAVDASAQGAAGAAGRARMTWAGVASRGQGQADAFGDSDISAIVAILQS